MYAKLINGNLSIAPTKLPGEDVIVYNPPEEMYLEAGYKPVVYVDSPEAPEGYHYDYSWEEQNDSIVQVWSTEPIQDELDEATAYNIIFGGDEQ